MSKKLEVSASDLKVDGTTEQQYVQIDNIRIRLARPLELDFKWVGNNKVVDQLKSAWFTMDEGDKPMNPRLIGKPGTGKTALAYSVGKMMNLPVYFFQATSDTEPNDVVIQPLVIETGSDQSRIEYVASPLVSAMIVGGAIVFDEGNRMQEKAWSALSPLLDSRRYIESAVAGVVIKAHPNFRFVSTMNDDATCFDLPDYIQSRLQPQVTLDFPERAEERRILEQNLPYTQPIILDYIADFLQLAHKDDCSYSVRDGISIANYAGKVFSYYKSTGQPIEPGEAVLMSVEQILGVRQTRYIKQILFQERSAA
jgi:MoxR-like ATPase